MNEQLERRALFVVALIAFGWLVQLLSPVLTPFIAAALLAYIGDPLADALQRVKLPRSAAVLIVFLITFIALGALVILIIPLVRAQASALFEALPRYIEFVETNWLPYVSEAAGGADNELGLRAFVEQYGAVAGEWASTVLTSVGRSGGALLAAAVSLFLIPVLTFYLLRDWDDILERVARLIPPNQRPTVLHLARESDVVLGAFLRGQVLVMFGLALIYTVGLSIIGLPYAIAIGVVAGLVSFVPYLGLVFGIALAGVTALNEPNGLLMLALVVGVFVIGQVVEGSILTPKLVGDRIGLHPVVVIFAVMAFGQLFGFFGVLLALPAAAVISVIVRYFYARYAPEEPTEDTPPQ
ncbi:MAG: AI-2E family transporter [Pseudomonadota bacterium]